MKHNETVSFDCVAQYLSRVLEGRSWVQQTCGRGSPAGVLRASWSLLYRCIQCGAQVQLVNNLEAMLATEFDAGVILSVLHLSAKLGVTARVSAACMPLHSPQHLNVAVATHPSVHA